MIGFVVFMVAVGLVCAFVAGCAYAEWHPVQPADPHAPGLPDVSPAAVDERFVARRPDGWLGAVIDDWARHKARVLDEHARLHSMDRGPVPTPKPAPLPRRPRRRATKARTA